MIRAALIVGLTVLSLGCTAAVPPQNTEQHAPKLIFTHVDASAAIEHLAETPNAVILDIRTPTEFNAGHIDGAINIDFKAGDFKQKLAELDRNTPYLVHCRSGGRSARSLTMFEELGFTDITHLDGGTKGWQAAGLALTEPCETC